MLRPGSALVRTGSVLVRNGRACRRRAPLADTTPPRTERHTAEQG